VKGERTDFQVEWVLKC